MSDLDAKICETPITGKYVAEHLKKSIGPHAVLRSIDAERIALGQGYASNIVKMKLTWESNRENGLPGSVVAKIPAVESLHKLLDTMANSAEENEKAKAIMAQMLTVVHKSECNFYGLFGNNPPVAVPKCYVALPVTDDAPGMIVLEDLSDRGAVPPSFVHGMTYPQVLATITEIARLHAWSLTTPIDWRSQIPKLEDYEQLMRGFLAPLAAGFKVTKEQYPNEFGNLDIEKCVSLASYENFLSMNGEHREFMDDVLVHGDMHMNNTLFEKKPNGGVTDRLVALLDFQGVMQGSPGYDFGRLLNFSVSHTVRRDHYEDILRVYYDTVKSIAGDKFKATFDQLRRITDRLFALGSVLVVASIPTVNHVMVKSEGEQKVKDEQAVLEMVKANFEDARKILSI